MSILDLLTQLEDTPIAIAVREVDWVFPSLETIHVVAIALVVGMIAFVDLRLLGMFYRNHTITRLSKEVIPWTWVGFAIAGVSGALLFLSAASKYATNLQFQIKFGLLILAGVNMLIFHFLTYRTVGHWDERTPTPLAAKIAGGLSLLCWAGVVLFGRWVGWTISASPF
jgi:hypothetical protein